MQSYLPLSAVDETIAYSSSEDEINPLNQNLQVLAERTLHEMFQINDATGPSSNIQPLIAEPSPSNIQPLNAEPSSNIQPPNGASSNVQLLNDARHSSSNIQTPSDTGLNLNIQYDDAGPSTPSIIRNDTSNLQALSLKPTNKSILTPIGLMA